MALLVMKVLDVCQPFLVIVLVPCIDAIGIAIVPKSEAGQSRRSGKCSASDPTQPSSTPPLLLLLLLWLLMPTGGGRRLSMRERPGVGAMVELGRRTGGAGGVGGVAAIRGGDAVYLVPGVHVGSERHLGRAKRE